MKYETINLHARYAPWQDDDEFIYIYDKVKKNTLLDVYRLYEIWNLTKQLKSIQGNMIEVGSWRGGCGVMMALNNNLTTYLCDTFNGCVKASDMDSWYKGGEHSDCTIEDVKTLINDLRIEGVSVLNGVFPEDTGESIISSKFKFAHIDVDTYKSAKEAFPMIYNRLVVGGIIVFDDYGFRGIEGITRLINETKEEIKGAHISYNLNGQAILFKYL